MSKENNLNELLNQGQSLIKSKEFDKALLVYEEIIKIDNLNHSSNNSFTNNIFNERAL